jgi:hypothetical protein
MALVWPGTYDMKVFGGHYRLNPAELVEEPLAVAGFAARYQKELNIMQTALEEFAQQTIEIFLKELPFEKRLEGIPLDKRLEGISRDQVFEQLSRGDFLKSLTPEQRQEMLRLLLESGNST